MELTFTKVSEIKIDSPLIGKVGFKQNRAPIVCLVFGLALMFVNSIWARLLAVFFVAMSLFVLKFVVDKPIMDVYESGVLIYNSKDENLGFYLEYKDIKQWKISRDNGHDSVIFEIENGQKTGTDTFQISKAYNYLMKACPSKEEREIQKEKNKKLKFANPIETLRNIGKRISNKK